MKTQLPDTLYLRTLYVVVNNGWLPDAFVHQIERHLGECHTIGELHEAHDGWSYRLVGFGGETWRGRMFYKDGKVRAFQPLPNFDYDQERLAIFTCGLAELTHTEWARKSDVIPPLT